MVKVSVLMPVYKTPELYLREAIESIVKQTFAIRVQAQTENPALYNFFQMEGLHTYRIKLFGFLPLITIKSWRNKTSFYLFEKILLFSYKSSCKLKGKQYA